jgi:hypothetical protein
MTMKCPSWIDPHAFIPPEILSECLDLRDRVNAIIPELHAIAAAARPVLDRAETATRELTGELERDSAGYTLDIADGLHALASALNGSSELYDLMLAASNAIHPEEQKA